MSTRDYFTADVDDIEKMLADAGQNRAFDGKRVLLTGAGGFLGRWMLRVFARLSALGYGPERVMALDALATVEAEARAELGEMDFVDFVYHDLKLGFSSGEKFDFILHLAGIASPHWYQKFPLATIDVAVNGSRLMLEKAKEDGAKYLFTSSSEVYQTPPPEFVPTPETYVGAVPTMGERSCYDVSKLMGETLAYTYAKQFGVKVTVVRLFNVFGAGIKQQDHRILPRMASAMKSGTMLQVFGDVSNLLPTRTYCSVANSISGILLSLARGNLGPYNIGVDSPEISVVALADRVRSVTNRRLDVEVVPPPSIYNTEPRRRCPDISKAKRELGYDPIVGLDDALLRYFTWALDTYHAT